MIETVSELIAGFEAENPGITVQVEYLSYSDGDSLVAESIQNGTTPNLILEGPARLAAAWGGTYPYAGHSYYTWKAKLPPIPPKGHGSFAALVLFPVLQSV